MDNKIRQCVNNCKICTKHRNTYIRNSLITHLIQTLPFEIVNCDILTFSGYDLSTIVDHYLKWLEIIKISRKTASKIVKQFRIIISVRGCPKLIFSDNVPFGSREFRQHCKDHNIELKTSSPNYPQSNGMVEWQKGLCKRQNKY